MPSAPVLTLPANGAIEIGLSPTLNWNAATQADSYDLQIATDSGFGQVIYSETVTGTSHEVAIRLESLTEYFWRVQAENGCGTGAYSATYSFTTLDIPNFFTEEFANDDNDLDNFAVALIPDGSGDYYEICGWEITELPTDPAGGTNLSLSDDDSVQITPTKPVWLYGTMYNSIHVGSNGYLTFTAGDTDYSETLDEHFEMARVAGLYDDLNPTNGGTVSWKESPEHVAVTWQDIREYSYPNGIGSNTFQIEMFFATREIHISWLSVSAQDGIVGLSNGDGMPTGWSWSEIETDYSAAGPCESPCPADITGDDVVNIDDIFAVLGLWGDCADPCPPYCVGDITEDCTVNIDDVFAILGQWGDCN